MATQTNIEWTDFKWNFLSGCSRKSAGCENCYAEKMTKRLDAMGQEKYKGLLNDYGRFNGTVKFSEKDLLAPLSWKKPRKVFVNSMSDLFHEKVQDEWLDKAFAVMALTPQHTYQILTKRPERMRNYFEHLHKRWNTIFRIAELMGKLSGSLVAKYLSGELEELPNVWLGVSVEDQKTADERIPLLLQTPAAVHWISAEPLLGPVNLRGEEPTFFGSYLNWVVVGGESGPKARPFDIQWARDIIAQCKAADVPVFVKQLGSRPFFEASDLPLLELRKMSDEGLYRFDNRKGGDPSEWPEDLRVREFPR